MAMPLTMLANYGIPGSQFGCGDVLHSLGHAPTSQSQV